MSAVLGIGFGTLNVRPHMRASLRRGSEHHCGSQQKNLQSPIGITHVANSCIFLDRRLTTWRPAHPTRPPIMRTLHFWSTDTCRFPQMIFHDMSKDRSAIGTCLRKESSIVDEFGIVVDRQYPPHYIQK